MSLTSLKFLTDEEIILALKGMEVWEAISGNGRADDYGEDARIIAQTLVKEDETITLVLDESISSVDRENEDLVVSIMTDDFRDHTVLSLMHKLNTIMNLDRLAVMDVGKIFQIGKPTELLKEDQGIFRALYKRIE
ncbi:P-loop containing nucleoside triphosphate hydrolase protein [Calycina marina]|uniref:P-loop containing nucleoside triphosphate hydrolase protein n=1 Tax=Calycina marina TaxID=1763456 RepID=A0A9P7YYR1_9HELO|nr:P-loop containing nucleoside triphosphate hydrolase protein [Calycina marina]